MPVIQVPTRRILALIALCVAGATASFAAENQNGPAGADGRLADGALWVAKKPAHWNGTLLLFSHGYSPVVRPPELAPRGLEESLLAQGYALAASAYGTTGWAVAEAVPDQIGTLDQVVSRWGKPKRVIAWGESMGALITVALAEKYPQRFSAALPSCGSIAGAVAMMNQALDGAFAFKVLLAPDAGLQLVHIDDDMKNAAVVDAALAEAIKTPAGRARLALASALAQLPPWTGAPGGPPANDDIEGQVDEAARTFTRGVFLPRVDQERRAGGTFSWNIGINYGDALTRSGRSEWVRAMYAKAGLNLEEDIAMLDNAPRAVADANAVAYMTRNYVPTGKPHIPVLSMHTIGDGLTIPAQQAAFQNLARRQGATANVAIAWVNRAGHCTFSPAEHLAALNALVARLDSNTWQVTPADLNAQGGAGGFVDYAPPDLLRACGPNDARCRPSLPEAKKR